MYSGWLLTNFSGNILGGHQKIDRISRKHLGELVGSNVVFPSTRQILHFEGNNGPDGVKKKSPGKDEPWHYYDPFDPDDSELLKIIEDHFNELVKHLKHSNVEKASFESAWLSHAVVDGLTPAHHYPYEAELLKLRGGGSLDERKTIKEKLYFKGESKRKTVKNNWAFWGVKGLFTTHYMFEFGFSSTIAPLKLNSARPKESDIAEILQIGVVDYFCRRARDVAMLNMYEDFYARGWTPKLARTTRKKLAPVMVKTVTLMWYVAVLRATTGNK